MQQIIYNHSTIHSSNVSRDQRDFINTHGPQGCVRRAREHSESLETALLERQK